MKIFLYYILIVFMLLLNLFSCVPLANPPKEKPKFKKGDLVLLWSTVGKWDGDKENCGLVYKVEPRNIVYNKMDLENGWQYDIRFSIIQKQGDIRTYQIYAAENIQEFELIPCPYSIPQ